MVETIFQDLRDALRALLRKPAFTALAVVLLALGIGANTAIFSVVDAALLKPMPYPAADRLVQLSHPHGQWFVWFNPRGVELWPTFRHNRAFKDIGVFVAGGMILGDQNGMRLRVASVTPEFFRVLDVPPIVGRAFTAADVERTGEVALLSHALWKNRFGSDRDIVGRSIKLNGRSFIVLGVMPPRVELPASSEVWIPNKFLNRVSEGRIAFPVVIGRLRDGVSRAEALGDVQRIAGLQAEANSRRPGTWLEDGVRIVPLRQALLGDSRSILFLVAAAALLVLLAACVNTANLLMTRLAAQQRALSVRRALGASDADLIRHLLSESLVLAAVAGLVTIPITFWTLDIVRSFIPQTMYGSSDIEIGARTFVATAIFSVTAAVFFSLAPALSVRALGAADLLRASLVATADPFWRRLRSGLVVAEIAIAVMLLAGAVTVVRTVNELMSVEMGVRGEGVVVADALLPRVSYTSAERVRQFYQRMEGDLRALPGVQEVAAASGLPGVASEIQNAELLVDGPVQPTGGDYVGSLLSVTPRYFSALGIDIIAGRAFSTIDQSGSAPVVIISERFVNVFKLQPRDVVGRRAILNHRYVQIVGVARDVRLRGPESGFDRVAYVPFAQQPVNGAPIRFVVKAGGRPDLLIPEIRAVAAKVDPTVPAYSIRTFEDIRRAYLAQRRFVMKMILTFGLLATILATLGLYGVIGYLVQLQTREIGILMALGATASAVRLKVLTSGMLHAIAGISAGCFLALGAFRFFSNRIPSLGQIHISSLVLLAIAGIAVAAAAAWFPARRATLIDPVQALRFE